MHIDVKANSAETLSVHSDSLSRYAGGVNAPKHLGASGAVLRYGSDASALKNGDVIQGKVSVNADGKASITLQDGSTLNATLGEGVSLTEGQNVKLMVTGRQDGKVIMQIVPEGDSAQNVIAETLSNLNINGSGRNVELAASFIKQGISLSPELMQKAADILAKDPGLDADTAVFMAANSMEADLGQAVQDLASKQNNIASQIDVIEQHLDTAPEAPKRFGALAPPAQLDAPEQHLDTAPEAPKRFGALAPPAQLDKIFGYKQSIAADAPEQHAARQTTASPITPGASESPGGEHAQAIAAQGEGSDAAGQPVAVFQPGPETVKALTLYIGRDNPASVAALQADGLSAAANAVAQAAALPEQQGEAIISAFLEQLDIESGFKENTAAAPAQQPDAATATSKLHSQLTNAAQALRETVQPQQNGGLSELLGKLESMFAKLDQPSKSVDIKQAANRLPARLEDLQQAIDKAAISAAGKDGMTAAVQRAASQSKAMEQINQFVYTQIPMDMNGQKRMAELYVFKRPGKQKRIDAEQVTMVIALDTRNIGHVESLIKVDGKNVFLRFKVDDKDVSHALEGGVAEVAESLSDIGYNLLELKCELNEEEINILNAASISQIEFLDRKLDLRI